MVWSMDMLRFQGCRLWLKIQASGFKAAGVAFRARVPELEATLTALH